MVDVGVSGSASLVVSAADTAAALGSGDVPVLGTPRVVALCEAATVAALRGTLADGETSVGSRVELDHLRPSYAGASVTASAVLDAVDGRRLDFRVEVAEGETVVARGRVVRVVVDAARFSADPRKTSDA